MDNKWFNKKQRDQLEPLLAKAESEGWAWAIKTRSDYQAILEGCYFDISKAERFRKFAEGYVRQVNGEWKGKPFKLFDWQWTNVICPIFGWLRPDGTRRIRRAYISVPKKSGKSALSAVIQLYCLMADGEQGANCFCAALDRKQAGLVLGEAIKYAKASPELAKRLNIYESTKRITFESTYSMLTALSADKDTSEGIDAHVVVYDELHMAKTDSMYNILRFAGAARRQPLFIVITTAGNGDTETICYKEYSYARAVKNGDIVDISQHACIYEADLENDDPGDPKTWAKANPSLGLTVKEDELRDAYNQAVETGKLANFRRRRLNQWVKNEDFWLSKEDWEACAGDVSVASSYPCWMGLDLADSDDINALVLVWKNIEAGTESPVYVKPFFWCPEDSVRERTRNSFVPYLEWVQQGHLFTTPGGVTDYEQIIKFVLEKAGEVQLKEFGFDPWQALQLVNRLEMEGLPVVKVPQTLGHLSPATKEVERLVRSKQLVHDGNPVLAWMFSNVVLMTDSNENMRPNKKKSQAQGKIDGVAALVTAMARVVSAASDDSLFGGTGLVLI